MIDTDALRKAVQHFKDYAGTRSANESKPCTAGELNHTVKMVATVLTKFIEQIEADQGQ